VSRTRCGILHAAPQSRDRTKHRLCTTPFVVLRESSLMCTSLRNPIFDSIVIKRVTDGRFKPRDFIVAQFLELIPFVFR